jgi:hypothetical protein
MAEEWRRKTYYKPRVLIPVDECLDSAFGDCLVCLTGGQLNLVRNLLLYAERRSTFVSEYEPNTYLAPTTEEWDDLQEMVADLEGNLMDCEQFTSDLQEILDWVRQQGSLTPGPFTEDEETAFPYDDVVGDDELTPAEEDACDVAQLWFEWGYQVITEHVLPATRWGFDYLVPAVAGFIALAIGGPPAAMGVYALAELIQELLEIFYRGAETNLVNWMTTNKEDIVCVLFSYLVLGGDASDMWAAAYAAVVEPAEDISAGDKMILSLFMGSWAGSNALKAFDAETEWATSNVEAGYCDECDPYGPTGLFWRPDSTCWYDNGEGWTKYWVPADPVETVPAEYAQEIKWQPDTLNNLTVHLHDEEDDPAGELIWRMRVYDEHGTFGQFFTGHNLTGISHAQELKEVRDSPWDWDDMNWCNMARDGQWGFAYTVNPDHHVSFDIIG